MLPKIAPTKIVNPISGISLSIANIGMLANIGIIKIQIREKNIPKQREIINFGRLEK